MPRMTRSTVKVEHVDDDSHGPLSDIAPIPTPPHCTLQPVTIRSTTSPASFEQPASSPLASTMSPNVEPHVSSGDTTIVDDTEMTDLQGIHGPAGHEATAQDSSGTNGLHAANCAADPLQTMGHRSRQLIQVIQKLETLGIDSTLQSLPSFVVVGDQSAGKSSIIEAMCDISLPRSEGTCTRCPFQITTTAADPDSPQDFWSCKISLQYRYFYDPQGRTGPTEFSHWQSQQLIPEPFMTINDKRDLDAALQRAQLALLHPTQDPAMYAHPYPAPITPNEVSFSPNVVSLEIKAHALPELSLFDLPGAINVYKEQHQVRFVEALIKSFIANPKATVLLACSANSDIENSTAFRFVKECDAISRCMGVLTKPDLLIPQRYISIKDSLEKFPLGHSWYFTKQLSQEELDNSVSHAEARQRERDFFKSQPWTTEFAGFSDRFGIQNIQQTMSERLSAHILAELPAIEGRIGGRLTEIMARLNEFPAEPVSASHTVVDEVQSVVSAISAHMRSESMNGLHFRTEYRELFNRMGANLNELRPDVELGTPGYSAPTFELDDDDDNAQAATPTPKMRKGNNGQAVRTPQNVRTVKTETPRSRVKTTQQPQAVTKKVFKLDQVKHKYDRGSNSGLPGQIDPKVTASLIKETLVGWSSVTNMLINNLGKLLAKMVGHTLEDTLTTRSQTQLFAQVHKSIETFWIDHLNDQAKIIMHIVDCECHKPMTFLNLSQRTEPVRALLRKDRCVARVDEHFDPLAAEGNKVPSKPERMKRLVELEANLEPDEYKREVGALATPLAYYDLAKDRMVDTIANHLELGLLFPLETALRKVLWSDLRVTDEAHCVMLLAEDPRREQERTALLAEREKLQLALKELQDLPKKSGLQGEGLANSLR